MEGDKSNTDYFSSFIIDQSDTPNEEHFNEEILPPNKKLKVRRNTKETSLEGSNKKTALNGSRTLADRFKLKVKYDGCFKPINNGAKKKYCFGRQNTIYVDQPNYGYVDLLDDVSSLYPWDENLNLSLFFLDKNAHSQFYVEIEDNITYNQMIAMYEEKREVVVYVTNEQIMVQENVNLRDHITVSQGLEDEEAVNYEEGSDYCHSEDSYHSRHSDFEDEDGGEDNFAYEGEFYSYDKDDPKMEIGATYPHVVAFRRALNHYAVINDFEYNLVKSEPARVTATCANLECSWRIHAACAEDKVTFSVRTMQPIHSCCGVNRRGNKHATQGWVADRIINDLRNEIDIPITMLKKNLEAKYNLLLPYDRVREGKELALQEIHGKWADSFIQIGALKEEILIRNPGSIVDFDIETVEGNQHFQRFFIALGACTSGFLKGCRPYIGLDACHLKGKWKGVVAAATAIDGNNWMFPVAFAVMEGENEKSWGWFLKLLHEAIGMLEGLVISSDMQKGLQNALSTVYPMAEHRECMRHLFSNFKKHFHGDLFKFGLWGAARTYSPNRYTAFIDEMKTHCPEGIEYLKRVHTNIWSRSHFGTVAKCDYLTNNIAETFNSWISEERHKTVINLLDSIRQKIMVTFNRRRRIARTWKGVLVPKVADYIKNISRSLNGYTVHRGMDFGAEITKDSLRWTVNLEEQICSCRAWQVKGVPCVHAASFIASLRNVKWENYVNSYFTVEQFKLAYDVGIAQMPSRDDWAEVDLGYKMLPPTLKRPVGRPRKNRMKPSDEPKKRSHKCTTCGLSGHHRSTCKNTLSVQAHDGSSSVPVTQGSRAQRNANRGITGSKKRACPPKIFRLLQEEKI